LLCYRKGKEKENPRTRSLDHCSLSGSSLSRGGEGGGARCCWRSGEKKETKKSKKRLIFFSFLSRSELSSLSLLLKSQMALRANRMARELKLLSSAPPPGVAVWPVGDGIGELRAQLRVREEKEEKEEWEKKKKKPFRAVRFAEKKKKKTHFSPLFFPLHLPFPLPIPISAHSDDRDQRVQSTREARSTSA
jgi:hypothetical protein